MNEASVPQGREAQLLSARFSCGVGWLMNALLELDVQVSVVRQDWPRPTWVPCQDGLVLNEPAYATLHQIMPAVRGGRAFTFQAGLEVLSEHYIHRFARRPERPTILYVRDPRDAIYSWYRRFHRNEMTLAEYLCKPTVYDEGRGETNWLDMPPPHVWAVYHLFWLALADCMDVCVIRYEDMKADPVRETRRALEHLGVERDDAQIEAALALSTFERTKTLVETSPVSAGAATPYAAKGRAGEWKETYADAELTLFDGPAALAMRMLGYETTRPVADIGVGALTFAALLDAATPAARSALVRAQADLLRFDPEAACRRLAEALTGDLGDPAHDGALAAALAALRWTRAIFTDAGLTDPTAQRAFGLFACLHLLLRDDPHFRLAQMQELTRLRPDLPAPFDRLAVTLYALGRPREAEATLTQACAGRADSALLRSNLAALHWEAGRHAQAFEQIGRGMVLDPDHPVLRQNIAAVRAALGYEAPPPQ